MILLSICSFRLQLILIVIQTSVYNTFQNAEPVVEQSGSSSEPNEGNIEQMMSMGFTRPQCIAALNATVSFKLLHSSVSLN